MRSWGWPAIIDEVAGARRADAGASVGTYLALAALNRLVAPCSKLGFADWWKTTAADRFAKIPGQRWITAGSGTRCTPVELGELEEISQAIALRIVEVSGVDCSSVALDMTNFATFIDTANGKAPIAQRGKAKQKRADLRLVGLGLVVTRDGGIPLTWHAYPGDRPDVTQFPVMIGQLRARHQAICAAAGAPAADMTVVFDAGQNSEGNFAYLAGTGLNYVGSVPASDCPDLTALPASARSIVDEDRFGALTAFDTRRDDLRHRAPGDPHSLTRAARRPGGRVRPAPPSPRPRRSWMNWPPPSPAARPAGLARRSRPRSPRPPGNPGSAAWSPGSWLASTPGDLRLSWGIDHGRPRRPGRRTLRQARADHRS